jgi:octaprenyl-diphosphate synthase
LSWEAPVKRELALVEDDIRKSVASDQNLLTDICMHVIGAGGKRMRPGVCLLSYRAAGGKGDKRVVGIAAAFELIHNATLIHDDINDGGQIRRGRVAAYKKYGVQKALVAGDFLFVRSFKLGGNWSQKVVDVISDACTATAESEILQSGAEFKPRTPVAKYLKIIEGKTARPIEAAAVVGANLAGASAKETAALGAYGLSLGIAFQIVDDILDIDGEEKVLGKGRGLDFLDGKPTLPLILAMRDEKVGTRLGRMFAKRDKSKADVEEALRLVRTTDAVEVSRARAREYAAKAVEALAPIKESRYKRALVELARQVVERDA